MTTAAAVAAVIAAAAAWTSAPGDNAGRLGSRAPAPRIRLRGVLSLAVGATAAASAGVLLRLGVTGILDVGGLVAVCALVRWLAAHRRNRTASTVRRLSAIGLCGALAAELHAGLPPSTALSRAAEDWPEFAPVARSADLGGDVADAFRLLARRPGAEGLRAIAAGWSVAAHTGASLAAVLDRIGAGLRDHEAARAEAEAALAPSRATARMLAVLPAFGVLLGTSMGAAPMLFLLDTSAGRICLLAGVILALAGVGWVERLAAAAERG